MNLTTNITIPTQSDPVPAMSVFGWIMIQQRLGYAFNWSLTWVNYKAGFGSIDANFWLGLEKMHLLTSSQPYRLRVEIQERWSAKLWYSAEFWSLKIGDELNDKYRLEVSGYSGDAGDSIQWEDDKNGDGKFGKYYQNGMEFSTYDQDNDLYPWNCAFFNEGGFWYNSCHAGCLTCKKGTFVWYTISTSNHQIANSRMLIKPQ